MFNVNTHGAFQHKSTIQSGYDDVRLHVVKVFELTISYQGISIMTPRL